MINKKALLAPSKLAPEETWVLCPIYFLSYLNESMRSNLLLNIGRSCQQ